MNCYLRSILLLLVMFPISCNRSIPSNSGKELPQGLVKGSLVRFGDITGVSQEFEIQEVRGVWIRATAISPHDMGLWTHGAEVWINLTTINQLVISPKGN